MTYFSKDKAIQLYGSENAYIEAFAKYVDKQQQDGWLTITDAKKMKVWSIEAAKKVFN